MVFLFIKKLLKNEVVSLPKLFGNKDKVMEWIPPEDKEKKGFLKILKELHILPKEEKEQ